MFLSGRETKRRRGGDMRLRGLRGMHGLGTIATQVGNALVASSDPVGRANVRTAVIIPVRGIPARPVGSGYFGPAPVPPAPTTQWGVTPPMAYSPWTAGNSPYGSSPLSPTGASLATAQALLQSNPSLLTQAQWTQLQQAGLVANTVPYGSASQIPSSTSAIDPATGVPYATELAAAQSAAGAIDPATGVPYSQEVGASSIGTTLDATYAGLPLYLWLIIGAGGLYLFTSRRGR